MFRRVSPLIIAIVLLTTVTAVHPVHAQGNSGIYTVLSGGYSQELISVSSSGNQGGIAFAPNGDPWFVECNGAKSHLHRVDLQTTTVVHQTSIHPETTVNLSASLCSYALINSPDGAIYANTVSGIAKFDADTGAVLETFGLPGSLLESQSIQRPGILSTQVPIAKPHHHARLSILTQ